MSLEPIAGESLVSYLLRLAYRLSLPPLHLARMAGWANGPRHDHLARKLLLDISPPQAEASARLARLTTEEVAALTLFVLAGPVSADRPVHAGSRTPIVAGLLAVHHLAPVLPLLPCRRRNRSPATPRRAMAQDLAPPRRLRLR